MTLSGDSLDADADLIQQVVSIVSAYVSHNAMRAVELPDFIGAVHSSIRQLSQEKVAAEAKPPNIPAVPIKRSISKDFIICLEDGKKFKSLRRHLSSCYNMTPDEYRAKWGLPSDYPMVAPAYSATRSQLARESGLGQVSRSSEAVDAPEAETAVAEAPVAEAEDTPGIDAGESGATAVVAEKVSKNSGRKAAGGKDVAEGAATGAAAATDAAAPDGAPSDDGAAGDQASAATEPAVDGAPKKPKRGRPKKVAA